MTCIVPYKWWILWKYSFWNTKDTSHKTLQINPSSFESFLSTYLKYFMNKMKLKDWHRLLNKKKNSLLQADHLSRSRSENPLRPTKQNRQLLLQLVVLQNYVEVPSCWRYLALWFQNIKQDGSGLESSFLLTNPSVRRFHAGW